TLPSRHKPRRQVVSPITHYITYYQTTGQYKYLSEHAIKFVGSTLALTLKCENAYYKLKLSQ
ncbi:hypothetical protein, partial [Fischerella thermalis]|uniref:hypothetical protein n=1 Tax=Fischerella thermalis TaxID=372787 RepID=UPI001CA5D38E